MNAVVCGCEISLVENAEILNIRRLTREPSYGTRFLRVRTWGDRFTGVGHLESLEQWTEGTMCVWENLWDSLWKKQVRKAPKLDEYPPTLSVCSSRQSSRWVPRQRHPRDVLQLELGSRYFRAAILSAHDAETERETPLSSFLLLYFMDEPCDVIDGDKHDDACKAGTNQVVCARTHYSKPVESQNL